MRSSLGRQRQDGDLQRDVVLLAEGKDEVDLTEHLAALDAEGRIEVIDCGGKDGIDRWAGLVVLMERWLRSGRALGVVLDADVDAAAAFHRTVHTIERLGLPAPTSPAQLVTRSAMTTGIYVTPGRGEQGTVEDLYLAVADPERRALAARYLNTVEGAGLEAVRTPSKATLQALLAALPRSPRQPGDGLQQGLAADMQPLEPLRRFLRDLAAS